MSKRKALSTCTAAALTTIVLFVSATPVHAARGDLEIADWSNGFADETCGEVAITFYNASTAPVLWAKVLYYTEQNATTDEELPFKGTRARSWVKFKMYLKPGGSKTFRRTLCSTLPPKGHQPCVG